MSANPSIHRFTSSPEGAFVNAYLVETPSGIVAVDAMLTRSDSRRLRTELEALGKPLLAVLLTQSHPDHYGGLTELVAGDDVPVLAPQGVHDVIRRDDPVKEQILRPMFGDEWPAERTFPNKVVRDGESVSFDGATFTVIDLGPSESPHDSPWIFGDDFYGEWLANIETLRQRFPDDAVFHIGHGGPVGVEAWDWQRGYIETFVQSIEEADWADADQAREAVVRRMKEYLPGDELQFLMELSIDPVAAKLGLLAPAAAG
jgi:glyoxylase-like metal-dependent hydrolase (beta-lactamase superfamily II)